MARVRTNELTITHMQAVTYDPRTDLIEPQGWPDNEEETIESLCELGATAELTPVLGWDNATHLLVLGEDAPDWAWKYYLVQVEN